MRTRGRILDSAAYVLSRKGYAATRLSDVADHAQLQAPSLYYYFSSRDELVEEVMYTAVAHMRAHVQAALDALPADTSAMDRILVAVESQLRYELAVSDYATTSSRNASQLLEHLRARHDNERAAYGSMWRSLISDAKRSGELNPAIEIRAARMLVIGAITWAVEWWNPNAGSLDSLVETARIVVHNGLRDPGTVVAQTT